MKLKQRPNVKELQKKRDVKKRRPKKRGSVLRQKPKLND